MFRNLFGMSSVELNPVDITIFAKANGCRLLTCKEWEHCYESEIINISNNEEYTEWLWQDKEKFAKVKVNTDKLFEITNHPISVNSNVTGFRLVKEVKNEMEGLVGKLGHVFSENQNSIFGDDMAAKRCG